MAFSTILVGTLIVYLLYYAVNIIYDLFFSGTSKDALPVEEEIEISDEENTLETSDFVSTSSPSAEEAGGDEKFPAFEEQHTESEMASTPAMNGALDIDDLYKQVQESETPAELMFITQSWNT